MLASICPCSCACVMPKIRLAPGLADKMVPLACSTSTPEVRLSKMVCSSKRDASRSLMLLVSAWRVSANCCVIWAKERVRPPSSSCAVSIFLGLRSPAATWRTPSARYSKGRASCAASSEASSTAPNTAKNKVSVSVPMNMRCRPRRASARSW